jgi:dihydrolipoamide dehydrogenase
METIKTDIVVIGAGPGGYAGAFYAADLGKKVIMVEQEKRLGGVCLNRGCIPSKAYLHAAKLVKEAQESSFRGITFDPPRLDLVKMREWKESILNKLAQGISGLAKRRGCDVMHGRGYFEDAHTLRVETEAGQKYVQFEHAIIAVGSKAAMPKAFDLGNPRIMTATEALEIEEIPGDLLIVGGGYIGLELGTVYATFGSKVVVMEAMDSILTGADPDLTAPVLRYAQKAFREMRVKTRVLSMATAGKKIKVVSETEGEKKEELYDRVLVCVGRTPNGEDLGLENTAVERDERGYIKVNHQGQTAEPHIYAVGDIAGGILLAHKAAKEARIAVEVIAGEHSTTEDMVMPAVVFTDPEVAWAGLTEADAKERGLNVEVVKFPWSASGRALSFDRTDGLTKILVDRETERILGVGICGHGAGELISEGVFAIEMGATAKDLAECIHPHPTLSETLMECAEVFYDTATHTLPRHKKRDVAAT